MNSTIGGVSKTATQSNHGTEVDGVNISIRNWAAFSLSLGAGCTFAGSLLLPIVMK
jgi:hypothetical protein